MKLCGCLFHKLGLLYVKFCVNVMKITAGRKKKVGTVFFGHPVIEIHHDGIKLLEK